MTFIRLYPTEKVLQCRYFFQFCSFSIEECEVTLCREVSNRKLNMFVREMRVGLDCKVMGDSLTLASKITIRGKDLDLFIADFGLLFV